MSGLPPCVECRRQPADTRWRPFCSERCQLVDLGRWLQGGYRVPEAATPDSDHEVGREAASNDEDDPQPES